MVWKGTAKERLEKIGTTQIQTDSAMMKIGTERRVKIMVDRKLQIQIGMTQIQTDIVMMKTGTGRGMKSTVDTELDIQIAMIQRGLDMMTLITTRGGIMKSAILEMSTETGGIVECRSYLKMHLISMKRSAALVHLVEQGQ